MIIGGVVVAYLFTHDLFYEAVSSQVLYGTDAIVQPCVITKFYRRKSKFKKIFIPEKFYLNTFFHGSDSIRYSALQQEYGMHLVITFHVPY